jgi:phosphatidylserine/phosphatidylglycerophosphate/cardiolipin synthase-like enzyme
VSLLAVGLPELEAVAAALASGRLRLPLTSGALAGLIERGEARTRLLTVLTDVQDPKVAAELLRCVAAERRRTQAHADRVELVWSGPEMDGHPSRDTAVVVRDLFRQARHTVRIVSYALDYGDRAEALFGELAKRLDTEPELTVQMFVNVHRDKSAEPDAVLLHQFAQRFRAKLWPGERLPTVYYDPRALAPPGGPRACLHAKCVVIDATRAFVTSANFTEAAQMRNIEAGVLVDDPSFARHVNGQLDGLVAAGVVRVVGGLG